MTAAGRAVVAAEAQEQLLAAAKRQADVSGFLVGFRNAEEGVVVLSCCTFCAEEATVGLVQWETELLSLQDTVPCGISVVGLFCSAGLEPKLESALAAVRKHIKTDEPLVAACVDEAVEGVKWSSHENGSLTPLAGIVTTAAKELLSEMTTMRLTSKVVSLPKDAELRCSDLASAPTIEPSAPAQKKGGKKGGAAADPAGDKGGGSAGPVQLQQMWSLSVAGQPAAPVLSFVPTAPAAPLLPATVDVLGVFPASSSLSHALALLRAGAARQLAALAALLKAGPGTRPAALHFHATPHQPFPVTACLALPPGELDAEEKPLLAARKTKHRQLLLPLDRPFLRTPQAISFAAAQAAGIQRLQNVHEGLPASGVKGGTVHCVQGRYEYCHYMQDKFNDDGWGCMYRSYQTVLSWFRLQHYTNKPIQSHEEIQRMLVRMGDKPDRFIGSKQWIGAMEASMLLDQHLSVQSKVINVASGHDLEDKGRELAQHFDVQGTPIPIGGGVLAFTILGVDFNPETGQVKFLILDPHYTGSEDLATIQNQSKKNGCSSIPSVGWHDVTVFRKDSFYNLCLPQRPTEI